MTLDPAEPLDGLYLELIPHRLARPWSAATCINTPAAQYARRMTLAAALEPARATWPLVEDEAVA